MMRFRLAVVSSVLALAPSAFGQDPPSSPPARCIEQSEVKDIVSEYVDVTIPQAQEKAKRHLAAKTPLAVPSAVQIAAPSAGGTSTSLVDGAGFPSLLGLAIESGLVESDDGVFTISVNPFAFLALADPEVMWDQHKYSEHKDLRRWGGSVSLGGKGEAFDRDGDGQEDDPLEAKELGDIVTWELKYRVNNKTRDRRDAENFQKLTDVVRPLADLKAESISEIFQTFGEQFKEKLKDKPDACYTEGRTREILTRPAVKAKLDAILDVSKRIEAAASEVFKEIDRQPIWTLVLGGTQRGSEFGADSLKVALRGSLGKSNVNLEWSRTEDLAGSEDPETFKAGYEYSGFLLKDSAWVKDGIKASVAATYEHFSNVPDTKHDTIATVGLKLEYPISEGLALPISVTWANHTDLLTDEEELRGHVGFTFDLSKLLSLTKKDG